MTQLFNELIFFIIACFFGKQRVKINRMGRPSIENLKAYMSGFKLSLQQKAQAKIEFGRLLNYISNLETKPRTGICYKKCGNTQPYNGICLNCGSSIE